MNLHKQKYGQQTEPKRNGIDRTSGGAFSDIDAVQIPPASHAALPLL